jgi:hypothetical protein
MQAPERPRSFVGISMLSCLFFGYLANDIDGKEANVFEHDAVSRYENACENHKKQKTKQFCA